MLAPTATLSHDRHQALRAVAQRARGMNGQKGKEVASRVAVGDAPLLPRTRR